MTTTIEPAVASPLHVNEEFAKPASRAALERAAAALEGHGIDAHVVPDRKAALDLLLTLLPEGAEVGQGSSATLEEIGATEVIERSGRFDSVRVRTRAMDRATQGQEIRRHMAAPHYQLNSAQAVTEDGRIVVAGGPATTSRRWSSVPTGQSSSSVRRRWCRTWPPHCGGSRSTRTRARMSGCGTSLAGRPP